MILSLLYLLLMPCNYISDFYIPCLVQSLSSASFYTVKCFDILAYQLYSRQISHCLQILYHAFKVSFSISLITACHSYPSESENSFMISTSIGSQYNSFGYQNNLSFLIISYNVPFNAQSILSLKSILIIIFTISFTQAGFIHCNNNIIIYLYIFFKLFYLLSSKASQRPLRSITITISLHFYLSIDEFSAFSTLIILRSSLILSVQRCLSCRLSCFKSGLQFVMFPSIFSHLQLLYP